MSKIKLFAEISKVDENDDGTIDVFGVASTELVDAQGEIVTKDAMSGALPDYFKYGTGALRSMHQPIAAGYVYEAAVGDDGVTKIAAKVVDPVEIKKVQTGVYKGFSIGGSKIKGGYDPITKTISKMRLTEISLVDRPANPEATISMWKGEDMEGQEQEASVDVNVDKSEVDAVNELAELINKGEASPAQIVEMIKKSKEPQAEEKPKAPEFTEEQIKKGMYSVRSLADILSNIQYLCSDCAWEAKSEGDNSPIPAQLLEWLKSGASILSAMAAEETAEMIAYLTSMDGMAPLVETVVVELSDKPEDINKMIEVEVEAFKKSIEGKTVPQALDVFKTHMTDADIVEAMAKGEDAIGQLTATAIEKIGAKISASNMKKIQEMHDHTVSMGAECKMSKADIAKVEEMCGETPVIEFINKLQSDKEELVKKVAKLEAQPAPAKATLRVITKGEDIIAEPTGEVKKTESQESDEPIRKADGSIDYEATATQQIMKIHQAGGRPFVRA